MFQNQGPAQQSETSSTSPPGETLIRSNRLATLFLTLASLLPSCARPLTSYALEEQPEIPITRVVENDDLRLPEPVVEQNVIVGKSLDGLKFRIAVSEGESLRYQSENPSRHGFQQITEMCRAIGVETVLIHFSDHIAVGVNGDFAGSSWHFRGKDYYFAEPAANPEFSSKHKFKVGVVPNEYVKDWASIYGSKIDGQLHFKDARGNGWVTTVPHQNINHYGEQSVDRCCMWSHDSKAHEVFVTPRDPTIRDIATTVCAGLQTNEEKAEALLRFVESHFSYVHDYREGQQVRDYHRFPVETLMRGSGDCEDSSYLFASLCIAAGIDTCLIRFPEHLAVGVSGSFTGSYFKSEGKQYYFAETTGSGARIGEISSSKENEKAFVFSLSHMLQPANQGSVAMNL